MGILLFNKEKIIPRAKGKMFSSPLWGFLYLITPLVATDDAHIGSRPLIGDFFYLID